MQHMAMAACSVKGRLRAYPSLGPRPNLKIQHCNNHCRSLHLGSTHRPAPHSSTLNLSVSRAGLQSAPAVKVPMVQDAGTLLDHPISTSPSIGASTFQTLGLVDNAVESTLEHHLWTAFGFTLATSTIIKAFGSTSPEQPLELVIGILVGYVVSDLVSGIVHWLTDNYGDATTPHFGPSIDAAQGHHQRPWVITTRHFANNVHVVTRTLGLFLIPFLLLPSHPFFHSVLGSSAVFGMMSQQCHAWAHMKKSRVPRVVGALQRAGLLLSAKVHGPHHKAPHESCYCIVSGMWNDVLKQTELFLRMERAVYAKWGVEPRCWRDGSEEWRHVSGYFAEGVDDAE